MPGEGLLVADAAVRQRLDGALALVERACDAALVTPDGAFVGGRLIRLQDLLVTAGATGDAVAASGDVSVRGLLEQAATLLDAIPLRERPVRLLPARVELRAVLLQVPLGGLS